MSESDARSVAGGGGGGGRDRQTDRHTDRYTRTDRQTETKRDRDSETKRQRESTKKKTTTTKTTNITQNLLKCDATSQYLCLYIGSKSVSFTKYSACVAKVSTTSIANLFLFFSAKERSNMAAL